MSEGPFSFDALAEATGPEDPERDVRGALHEVSNALTVVVAWLERAYAALPPEGEAFRAVDVAFQRSRRACHIARRALGAVDEGFDDERSAAQLIAEAIGGVAPLAEERGVRLSSHAEGVTDAPITAPAAALQILTNLLLNAVAFSPVGGAVRVLIGSTHGRWELRVLDEGPGLSEEQRAHLFLRERTSRPGGAGIGLRYSWALARRNGGELVAERSVRGAAFCLRWPRGIRPGSLTSRPPPSRPLVGQRVLLVEDDDAVLDLLETALLARGAEVVTARALEELGPALDAGPFDAALLDLSPLMGSLNQSLHTIRLRSPGIRVVAISGDVTADREILTADFSAWVRKPFEVVDVFNALTA
ncbi:MAG: hybrid sensor histidine kinase/response regulator [Polyangiaceae bacterium]|nr:hybrid sensor histidine kinase/response regulator [Polyangiaceae bacterium]